ncbi:hypothetical protein D8M04_13995 [Oceanobacillus piezotolerans]|uniref:Uncharacterized protein n=1 Tax=Oceanobacillus piezotolerans TaxID=2448030 RepID=A0A498DJR5_9BACI|nr:hypothetical protein D8M04_13995 [Oceanobacillus piezotolerans]
MNLRQGFQAYAAQIGALSFCFTSFPFVKNWGKWQFVISSSVDFGEIIQKENILSDMVFAYISRTQSEQGFGQIFYLVNSII